MELLHSEGGCEGEQTNTCEAFGGPTGDTEPLGTLFFPTHEACSPPFSQLHYDPRVAVLLNCMIRPRSQLFCSPAVPLRMALTALSLQPGLVLSFRPHVSLCHAFLCKISLYSQYT